MEAPGTETESAALKALAEVSTILEPIGLQEEAELPAQILAEFVMDSRKKDKLLCSQLQVVDFLQGFLMHEDTAQGLDPLASEDMSRQKAGEAKEHWKELKATYQEHVEAITSALAQAVPQMEEAQRKRAQLQDALEQLQAKKQVAMEKLRAAQKQWQLQQEKHLQHLAEVRDRQRGTQQEVERLYQELRSLKHQAGQEQHKLQRYQAFLQLLYTLQNKMVFPEAQAELQPCKLPLHLDPPEDKPQQLTWPQERNSGDNMVGDRGVTPQVNEGQDKWAERRGQKLEVRPYPLPIPCLPKVSSPQPAGHTSLPQLLGSQQHEKGFQSR
ncbi:ZW10 interactor [Orycteropus afer afer]|uniref:ZW10 interactor n=1 Tax=Orycteropus afer afer TaxID=1230840 RepID=A0A8B7BEG2_ORYAF|nr:ZW10 interactor [Orycteropus afer afer]